MNRVRNSTPCLLVHYGSVFGMKWVGRGRKRDYEWWRLIKLIN